MSSVEQYLKEIRDLLSSRGADNRATMPTTHRGVEVPLVMSQPVVAEVDLAGVGTAYKPIANIDVHHYTLGEILVSVESRKPAALFAYAAEIQIFGLIEGAQDILTNMVVNGSTGPARVLLPLGSAFQQISIQGRQLINGLGSSRSLQDATMNGAVLQASVKMRIYR